MVRNGIGRVGSVPIPIELNREFTLEFIFSSIRLPGGERSAPIAGQPFLAIQVVSNLDFEIF